MRASEIFNRITGTQQQAFLPGRNINYHIQTAKMIASEITRLPSPSQNSLMLLDISKAFDTLSHKYIPQLLQKYGFPNSFIKTIMQQNSLGAVYLLNNIFLYRKRITLQGGVRQGLPISPLIFNLCLEPLILALQRTLTGITYNPMQMINSDPHYEVFTHTTKLQAFADDIVTFNSDHTDIVKTLQVFKEFSKFSGLKINNQKSQIYSHPQNMQALDASLTRFSNNRPAVQSITDNPTYLGIPLLEIDWKNKLDQLYHKFRRILFMDLPLHIIIIGINTYIFSTLYFHDQHHLIPSPLLDNFLYQMKELLQISVYPPLPSHCLLWYVPRSQGGFGLIDLKRQLLGRRAHYILYSAISHTTSSNHPHFPIMMRIQLQMTAIASSLPKFIHKLLFDEIDLSIQRKDTVWDPGQLNSILNSPTLFDYRKYTWFQLITQAKPRLEQLEGISTEGELTVLDVNYSQRF